MTVVRGFEVLTGSYLGQDWDLFSAEVDDALALFLHEANPDDIVASIEGFEDLLASPMTDDELYHRWVMELHSAYDPGTHGRTFREFFSYAVNVLRIGPVGPVPELPDRCRYRDCEKCYPTDGRPPGATTTDEAWWRMMAAAFRRAQG